MDEKYRIAIINSAEEKLISAGKPLTELELIKGIVHRLKKCLGKDDRRHSAKGRFKRDSFKVVINTIEWEKTISQLENKKFVLTKDYKFHNDKLQIDIEWNWENEDKGTALNKMLSILNRIDPLKFEFLVRDVVKKSFPNVNFEVTVSTGDKGIDIFGTRQDPYYKERQEAICIQVKRYKGTVGRPEADKFIGAVSDLINDKNNKFSKFEGLFITSGKYPKSFNEKLIASSKTGVTFSCWDGTELAEKMIALGLGVKYSIDLNFWETIDPTIIPKIEK